MSEQIDTFSSDFLQRIAPDGRLDFSKYSDPVELPLPEGFLRAAGPAFVYRGQRYTCKTERLTIRLQAADSDQLDLLYLQDGAQLSKLVNYPTVVDEIMRLGYTHLLSLTASGIMVDLTNHTPSRGLFIRGACCLA